MRVSIMIPLFNIPLIVYTGEDKIEPFKKAVKKLAQDKSQDFEDSSFDGVNGRSYGTYIWMRTADLPIFAHELVHSIEAFMHHIGSDCEEVRAYTMQWCMDKFWPKINEVKP